MKAGGEADSRRKATCRERYGVDYLINRPDMLQRAYVAGKTPEACKKRKDTLRKNMLKTSVQLSRGLTINRSKAEIEFFAALGKVVGEVQCPKYINHWFIDGYVPGLDAWIQFDGVYWHSRPERIVIDEAQDDWFENQGLTLIRVTDVEWKNDPTEALCRAARLGG